CTTVVAPDSW
nr:immunoglobulin heavy chain junction region [Mus musculus]MBK4195977.1 immunoglobulin heavy chain junction region [Mus musculus]